jgi:hypothetical protein
MSGPVDVVLVLAAVCYVLVRRFAGEPAQARRMLVLPAVLVVIGLSDVSGALHSVVSLVFLVATCAFGMLLGALRGASVRLSERDGLVVVRYTVITLVLWVVNLAVRFGASFVLGAVDPHAAAAVGNSLLLTLGAGMLVEGLVTMARALHTDSRVVWATGRDGAPHTASPLLDNLRRTIGDRTGRR